MKSLTQASLNIRIPEPAAKVLWKVNQIATRRIPESQLPRRSEGHAHGASLRMLGAGFQKECWTGDPTF